MNSVRSPSPLRISDLSATVAVSGRFTPARVAACRLNVDETMNTAAARGTAVLRIKTPQKNELRPKAIQFFPAGQLASLLVTVAERTLMAQIDKPKSQVRY